MRIIDREQEKLIDLPGHPVDFRHVILGQVRLVLDSLSLQTSRTQTEVSSVYRIILLVDLKVNIL